MGRRASVTSWALIVALAITTAAAQDPLASDETGVIEGVVTARDTGQPLSGVAIHLDTRLSEPVAATDAGGEVTLVPVGNEAGRHDLYRSVETDAEGRFTMSALRPGAYRVFAWATIPEYAERNAQFLAPWLGRGRFVTVNQNAVVDVELDLIP